MCALNYIWSITHALWVGGKRFIPSVLSLHSKVRKNSVKVCYASHSFSFYLTLLLIQTRKSSSFFVCQFLFRWAHRHSSISSCTVTLLAWDLREYKTITSASEWANTQPQQLIEDCVDEWVIATTLLIEPDQTEMSSESIYSLSKLSTLWYIKKYSTQTGWRDF